MKIGLDIMGGDFAPQSTCGGAHLALSELSSDEKIVLIGQKPIAEDYFSKNEGSLSDFEFINAPDVIEMGEHPTKAFTQKPNSSISVGFGMLKKGEIDVFASVGNSGAMLVGSMYTVKTVAGVIRPCITTAMPREDGGVCIILDVGINADCKPDVLYQFGILGSIFAKSVYGIENPKVGLLNIGEEEEKGNMLTLSAHKMMKETNEFNFIGNVEGRDVFDPKVDVIVCDGFTGNVLLKYTEAFYAQIMKRKRSDEVFDKFNYEIYGGTPVLGVNGNVLIGHGISSSLAIKNMLLLCRDVVKARLTEKIKKAFND